MKRKLVGQLLLVLGVVFFLSGSSLAFEVVAEEEFSYQQVTSLEVSGKFCDIEVIGKEQVEIDFKGKIAESGFRLGGNYQIKYQNEGGKVKVKVIVKDKSIGFGQLKGKLKFLVPQQLPVKIKAASGDIQLTNVTGKNQLLTASGDVKAENCGGKLKVTTSSGDHYYQQLTGNLEINSASGDVTVQSLEGDIRSSSSSGDLELEAVEGQLNLETTSGDIDGTNVLLTEDSYLETTSGDIKIDLQNDLSELSFNLTSTSGGLRAGSLDSKKRLMIDRGKIMVKGESTSGNQEYY